MPPTLGVILAGGLARRMGGGDKTLLRLGGRTLLDRVAERLGPQCSAGLVLSANGDPGRFAGFDGSVLPDCIPDNPGPLAGILAALDFAAEDAGQYNPSNSDPRPEVLGEAEPRDEDDGRIGRVVSVSADAPFIPRDFVERLQAALDGPDDARIALAASARQHYTVALWPVALRHDLRAALVERGERRVGAFIGRHGSVVVHWPMKPFDPFLNINEPADLATAEEILADPDSAGLL